MKNSNESLFFKNQTLEKEEDLNKKITEQLWINKEEKKNLYESQKRIEHKHAISYYYKKIFNFLHGEILDDSLDKYECSKIFNTKILNSNSLITDKEYDIENILLFSTFNRDDVLCKFIYGLPFQIFLTLVIFSNSILLGVQTDNTLKKEYQSILEFLDCFSNSVFLIEFILKISYGFKIYFFNLWNIFDFFLLLIGLVSILTDLEYSKSFSASRLFRIFRVFRALRSLRSLHSLNKLQLIVNTFFKSIYDVVNIVALMLLSMIMFSLFGCNFFSNKVDGYFKNLDTGMLTIFYCSTREGLSDLFNAINDQDDYFMEISWKFFIILLIILFAFILTNLIVAVVVTNMQQALKDEEKKDITTNKDELKFYIDDFVPNENVQNMQIPVLKSHLQDLTIEMVEKYFLILNLIEDNLKENRKLINDLNKMVEIVEDLNKKLNDDSEIINFERDDLQTNSEVISKESENVDWENFANDGDILSNLIDLEKKNLFSSEKIYDFKSIGKVSKNKALLDIDLGNKRSRLMSLNEFDKIASKNLFKSKSYSSFMK